MCSAHIVWRSAVAHINLRNVNSSVRGCCAPLQFKTYAFPTIQDSRVEQMQLQAVVFATYSFGYECAQTKPENPTSLFLLLRLRRSLSSLNACRCSAEQRVIRFFSCIFRSDSLSCRAARSLCLPLSARCSDSSASITSGARRLILLLCGEQK